MQAGPLSKPPLLAAVSLFALSMITLVAPARADGRATTAVAAQKSVDEAPTPSPRDVTALMTGWRFQFHAAPDLQEEFLSSAFDDSKWTTVELPHSWNRIGTYQGAPRGENNSQGAGWYRKVVDAPAASPGERQYLDFGAVSKIADVWVNGRLVGTHKGAFGRFRLDVSEAWRPGARNLIVVRADNSKPEPGSTTAEVIPLSGDFFVHGGMYRDVSLLQLPSASIDPLDYGGPGVYAHVTRLTDDEASVEVLTRLRNAGSKSRSLTLTTEIRDKQGTVVDRVQRKVKLAKGSEEARATLAVAQPHLWNGRADPYLYSVTATLAQGGKVLDQVTQPLGLRSFRFDTEAGFFLNEKHLKLRGVSRHQDMLGQGWALTDAQQAKDMELIEELGANTVRHAHYQHADTWSDLADRAGMVVWAELPYVTTPSLSGGKGSDALWTNAEQQLREQIRQSYNHPSIFMWSVGNEVDSAKGFGVKGDPPLPLALLQRLNEVAKEEDPSRATAFADCCEGLGMIKTAGEKLAGTTDLTGYNRYYGWYYPKPLEVASQLGAALDKLHGEHPGTPISLTEYGAGAAITQHSDDVRSGYLNFTGRPHPDEYGAWLHEQSWPALARRDFVFASWVWAMFDFSSDLRGEGDSSNLNDKGLMTADRQTRKDAFWFYKTAWSTTPAIHFAGKRYVDRAYPVMDVKAYSTTPRASLTMDGRAIGETSCTDFVCEWKGVALHPGPNRAVVTARTDTGVIEDSMVWNGPAPASTGVHIDVGSLGGREVQGRHFGSDTFVTGGTPAALNLGGFGGRSLGPPRKVEASIPELFDYWREGDSFRYAIPIPDGKWTVTLRLFEPRARVSADQALTVTANGKIALRAIAVQKEAGAALRELVRTFPVVVTGGRLDLDFRTTAGKTSLAAIEISK